MMRSCLRTASAFLVLAAALLRSVSPCAAESTVWDAFVYHWTRVYTGFGFQDIYNCPADGFNSGNPVEVYLDSGDRLEDKDRFRFTFDGSSLSVNRATIRTVGSSSSVTFDLVLDPGWALCGSVIDGVAVPDPYVSFAGCGFGSGSVNWSEHTPDGHTTSLLLGYNATIRIRKHPTLSSGGSWEEWRVIDTASFPLSRSENVVPECGTLWALGAYLSSALLMRRRKHSAVD